MKHHQKKLRSDGQTGQGEVLIAIETLALDLSEQGRDYILAKLRNPELYKIWHDTLDAVPPPCWSALCTALNTIATENGSSAGMLPASSLLAGGIFRRSRAEIIHRIVSEERLQILAGLLPPSSGRAE